MTTPRQERSGETVHNWFGLTYSNFLVLHRAVLESMPEEWQRRFTAMLDELRETCERAKLETPMHFRVHVVDASGRFVRDPIPHYRHAPNILDLAASARAHETEEETKR